MSSTQLLVLGVVRQSQPVHGYDVRRTLLTWRADEWANVNPGSIYHALKTLTRDGFLQVAETSRSGSRPERTAYELTTDGETEFLTLLRESLWTVSSYPLPLHAGLAFVTALPHAEVLALLRSRVAQVDGAMASLRFVQTPDLDPDTRKVSRSGQRSAKPRRAGRGSSSAVSRRGRTVSLGSLRQSSQPALDTELERILMSSNLK